MGCAADAGLPRGAGWCLRRRTGSWCGRAGMCPCKGWPGGHAKRSENRAAGAERKKKMVCAGLRRVHGDRCEKGADAVRAARREQGLLNRTAGAGGLKRKAGAFCVWAVRRAPDFCAGRGGAPEDGVAGWACALARAGRAGMQSEVKTGLPERDERKRRRARAAGARVQVRKGR